MSSEEVDRPLLASKGFDALEEEGLQTSATRKRQSTIRRTCTNSSSIIYLSLGSGLGLLLLLVLSRYWPQLTSTVQQLTSERELRKLNVTSEIPVKCQLSGQGPAHTMLTGNKYDIKVQSDVWALLNGQGIPDWSDPRNGSAPNIVLWLQSKQERIVLEEPVMDRWDSWTFQFEVLSPGIYNATIYLEGEAAWPTDPYTLTQQSADESAYPLRELATFEISAFGSNEQVKTRLTSLPDCTVQQLLQARGRWMNLQKIGFEPDWKTRYIPPSLLSGSEDTFIPDTCLIPYTSQADAQTCLKDTQLNFVGDSTVEELANDLGIHLSGSNDTLPSNHEDFRGGSKNCDSFWYHMRLFNWPIQAIRSRISFTWAGHQEICYSGQGTYTFHYDFGKARILQALHDPLTMDDAPVRFDNSIPNLLDIPPASSKPKNILVYGSALHDLIGVRDGFFNFGGYVKQMRDALTMMRPYAKTHIFMPSNSIRDRANFWPRVMNDAASKEAKNTGYDVLPNYWIKQGRPRAPLPYGISTDLHHAADMYVAKQRSPWLHASTQALLMMLCGPEASRT